MTLIAKLLGPKLPRMGTFAVVRRERLPGGKFRYGKVYAEEEFPYLGTRAELDAETLFAYVSGEEDAAPAAPCPAAALAEPVPAARVPADAPKRRGRPPKRRPEQDGTSVMRDHFPPQNKIAAPLT